ncbi:MAG: DUF3800 domain-containing protein [Candidatus Aenigmatarchaeota archaeon]
MSWVKYVFVDESGDLGMYGSKFFTIAAIVTDKPKNISRIIKRVRERILKKKLKQLPEIKANSSNRRIREFVLRKIRESDCKIFAIVIDKSKIFSHLFEVKDKLYNYFCGILLNQLQISEGKLIITVDKKHTNTLIRENFNDYVKRKIKERCPKLEIEVNQLPSYTKNELQVVDFVAWSINRKFNSKDDSYYKIIEEKIANKERMELWK